MSRGVLRESPASLPSWLVNQRCWVPSHAKLSFPQCAWQQGTRQSPQQCSQGSTSAGSGPPAPTREEGVDKGGGREEGGGGQAGVRRG